MFDSLHRIWQLFYYGLLGRASTVDLSVIPPTINLSTHYDEVNKVYWVESDDLPDFEATGKTFESLAEHVFDSLLVYLDIPYYFARKMPEGELTITNPRVEGEIIKVTRAGIEKVLA